MSAHAYDYDAQCWVEGPRAEQLLREQRAEIVGILRSARGQEYLDFCRRKGEPRRTPAEELRAMGETP